MDAAEKPLRRGGENDSSPSSSDYSSSEEEARRRRSRKEKKKRKEEKRKHKRRKRKHSGSSSDNSEDESDEKKKRRKRRHHSSDDESEGKKKKKRHHSSDDEKHERRKKRRHHSSDDESSESESERRKKKKLLKEAKKILKRIFSYLDFDSYSYFSFSDHKAAEKSSQGLKAGSSKKVEQISEDDYYQKNNEFATWLKERHGLFFSNMTAEETRKLFVNFVDVWNSGKLADKYYEGIKTGLRTNHKWNFEDKQVDEEDERLHRRKREKAEQKRYQKEHELVMDELLPKATGKDRLFEKKAIEREKNRNRDLSPEPMRETDIMGGGDDFKMMLARERARREKKASQKAEVLQKKLSVVGEKEAAAMDQFRALVNTSGGKITIPKRS